MDTLVSPTRPEPPSPVPRTVPLLVDSARVASGSQAPETLSNRLARVIDGRVSASIRTPTLNVDLSDDSSLSREEAGFSDGAVGVDEDTASDSEDSEERLERVLNSSDTNAILDNLKIAISPSKIPEIRSTDLLSLLEDPANGPHVTQVDEFPLFPNRIRQSHIIEEERALSTPEKRGFGELDDSDSEEGSISKRTRSSSLTTSQDDDALSPISRKMQQFQNTKSRIPLPVAQIAVRRSKRLEEPEDNKRTCSPKKIDVPLKPVLKVKSTALNFIVDASSGFLHDATKYATEMNSLNGEGVPIPQTANELVTIPINERKAAKNPRSALLRGTLHKAPKPSTEGKVVGFYSEEQYKKYLNSSTLVEVPPLPKREKRLRWAEELEW